MSAEQPQSRGKLSPFELQQWFDQRFRGNDLSLTGLDGIAGPDGDRFRLLSAMLTALGGKPEQRDLWHPDEDWVLKYSVAKGKGSAWGISLLHIPRSVFEGITFDDSTRLEAVVRLIWHEEGGGTDEGFGCILITSCKSSSIAYGLRQLKGRLRERDSIKIDLRQWDDIRVLEAKIARRRRGTEDASLGELVADRSTGLEAAGREFFCLPPPPR